MPNILPKVFSYKNYIFLQIWILKVIIFVSEKYDKTVDLSCPGRRGHWLCTALFGPNNKLGESSQVYFMFHQLFPDPASPFLFY